MKRLNQFASRSFRRRDAFTLVEILVVFTVLLLLAAVALPSTKDLLQKQTGSRAARSVVTFFDIARNRAITENRTVGVLLERLSNADEIGRSAVIRMRQMTGVPSYTGDAAGAVGIIQNGSTPKNMIVEFSPSDNQLLALSASLVADPGITGDVDDLRAPIRNGDFLELPGGRITPFLIDFRALNAASTVPVRVVCDLTEQLPATVTELYPAVTMPVIPPTGLPFAYRIHRRPTVSTHNSLSLPRGYAIDMNYSGVGERGNQFAPPQDLTNTAFSVSIVFDPSGKVSYVSQSSNGVGRPPVGQIFLCLGKTDGIVPTNLFSQQTGAVANVIDPETLWLVIDPASGRVVSAPTASVNTIPTVAVTDPADASVGAALSDSRLFARLGDTVEQE